MNLTCEDFKTHLDVPVCEGRNGRVQLPHSEADRVEHGHQAGLRQGGPGHLPPLKLVMERSPLR